MCKFWFFLLQQFLGLFRLRLLDSKCIWVFDDTGRWIYLCMPFWLIPDFALVLLPLLLCFYEWLVRCIFTWCWIIFIILKCDFRPWKFICGHWLLTFCKLAVLSHHVLRFCRVDFFTYAHCLWQTILARSRLVGHEAWKLFSDVGSPRRTVKHWFFISCRSFGTLGLAVSFDLKWWFLYFVDRECCCLRVFAWA